MHNIKSDIAISYILAQKLHILNYDAVEAHARFVFANICGHKIRKANVADFYLNGKYMYFIVVLLQEHRFAPNLILFQI